jgi:hypothetical protein
MAIESADLLLYRAAINNDTTANGGRLSTTEITTAVKNSMMPDVSEADRTAGLTRYRKLYFKNANDDDETLENPKIHLSSTASGDDYVQLFEGTQTDTQNDIGTPTFYGVGTLKANVSAGGNRLVMVLEATDITVIRDADTIFITDGTNSEYHENVTISKASNEVTITLEAGDTLQNSYLLATPTYIASVIEPSDIVASADNYDDSEGADTSYNFTTYPVVIDNIGTIEQEWTMTVEDGGATFTLEGDTLGEVETGVSILAEYAPNNADFTAPYFTLDEAGWSGDLVGGEVLTFQTHPAAAPIWIKQVVPSGSGALAAATFDITIIGEST